MKKKVWNKATLPSVRVRGAYITVQANGNVQFSHDLAERLSLEKVAVDFVQDEDRPQDWYIELVKANPHNSFKLKASKAGFKIQSAALTHKILESLSLPRASFRIPVALEETEKNLYAVLTKGATPIIMKSSSQLVDI